MDDKNLPESNLDNLVKELSRSPSSPPAGGPISPSPSGPPSQLKPPLPPLPNQPGQYQSSIRTMANDLNQINTGKKVSGVEVPRTIPTPPPPSGPVSPAGGPAPRVNIQPVAPLPKQPVVELGVPEKTKPLSDMPPVPKPSFPPPPVKSDQVLRSAPPTSKAPIPPLVIKPTVPPPPLKSPYSISEYSIPDLPGRQAGKPPRRISKAVVISTLAILAIAGISYWYIATRNSEIAEAPTPTPSILPTPEARTVASFFSGGSTLISLSPSGDPSSDFRTGINTPIEGGTFRKFDVVVSSESGSIPLSLTGLFDRFLITYPDDIKLNIGEESLILGYGQREAFNQKGALNPNASISNRLVLIAEVNNTQMVVSGLQSWEPTLPSSLNGLFELGKNNISGPFIETVYRGVLVRYINFPYPDRSIDYALVPATNGKTYLVMSNSRESMFATIDVLTGTAQ